MVPWLSSSSSERHVLRCRCQPTPTQPRGTHAMHGRRCMTVAPRISTMPGWSRSSFHRPSRHCLHQAPSGVREKGEGVFSLVLECARVLLQAYQVYLFFIIALKISLRTCLKHIVTDSKLNRRRLGWRSILGSCVVQVVSLKHRVS